MPIYLANTTRQTIRFSYRVPGIDKVMWVLIPSGRQEQLDKTLKFDSDQTASIVQQMERYGARESSQVNRRLKDFDGLLYNLSKPVKENDFEIGNAALIHHQEERSVSEAVIAARTFDAATTQDKGRQRLAKTTAVEIIEDAKPGAKPTGDEIRSEIEISPQGRDKL